MGVTGLTGLIVCLVAPLIVASRRITGKVPWFFLTILCGFVGMFVGSLVGEGIAVFLFGATPGVVEGIAQDPMDIGALLGAVAAAALLFHLGDQKSRIVASRLNSFCANCGSAVMENSRFCAGCGSQMNRVIPTAAAPPPLTLLTLPPSMTLLTLPPPDAPEDDALEECGRSPEPEAQLTPGRTKMSTGKLIALLAICGIGLLTASLALVRAKRRETAPVNPPVNDSLAHDFARDYPLPHDEQWYRDRTARDADAGEEMLLARKNGLLGVPESQQAFVLSQAVGNGCDGFQPFYMGISSPFVFWSIHCYDGRSYEVGFTAGGSTKVLACSTLKAVAKISCFKRLEGQ